MLERLLDLFAPKAQPDETATGDRLRMATCVVLIEVAGADNEFSPVECTRIIEMLRTRFNLSQEEAERLIEAAQERREESSGLWRFTNQINQACSLNEKITIIEEIWRVIYADGTLDAHEDYLVHKLARLLNLTHPQLIQAKLRVLQETRGQG
jgi:uncharacterized tellurite resistance protein B-like protein